MTALYKSQTGRLFWVKVGPKPLNLGVGGSRWPKSRDPGVPSLRALGLGFRV